jgi:hypothetical protein
MRFQGSILHFAGYWNRLVAGERFNQFPSAQAIFLRVDKKIL